MSGLITLPMFRVRESLGSDECPQFIYFFIPDTRPRSLPEHAVQLQRKAPVHRQFFDDLHEAEESFVPS